MHHQCRRLNMNESLFASQLTLLRKEAKMTQEELAGQLHVSSQAISKWENGHSLPETALLPELARLLGVSIDMLFREGHLMILEALYGDGIVFFNVTKHLNRFIENDSVNFQVSSPLIGVNPSEERIPYLTLKYQTSQGICHKACLEGETICLACDDEPVNMPDNGLVIIAGQYGTKSHHYDVMQKVDHYRPLNWIAYPADHEVFPSDPANNGIEYLTLVYLNKDGIHMATCAEGESLEYCDGRSKLVRRFKSNEHYIPDVPELPPFGKGMECSWAAALTAALQTMKVQTDYDEVMGVSGACYRLAFSSPSWDYSSVDGLVAYDYATPGFAAFGYTPDQYGRIDKEDRTAHKQRIMKEIRNNMPVLGINLRIAPEWGVICGYGQDGEDLYCRTKYDRQTIDNDPAFMKGYPPFPGINNPFNYLYVDNWPFLFCYFGSKRIMPKPEANLLTSLKVFVDCVEKQNEGGYFTGIKAYEIWAADLVDDQFYLNCDDAVFARRFSVDQFCVLSLQDARRSASRYLHRAAELMKSELLSNIAGLFTKITNIAKEMQIMLDSGMELTGAPCRTFWTPDKRHRQADALIAMANLEREACDKSHDYLSSYTDFSSTKQSVSASPV